MLRDRNSLVFERVTGSFRKPVARFHLASGRQVEMLGFHLEPGWAYGGDTPRLIKEEVVGRLYPNQTPVIVQARDGIPETAFLCIAYFYSDTPCPTDSNVANYSALLLCGWVQDIGKGIRSIVTDLLSQVDWDVAATNDFMW